MITQLQPPYFNIPVVNLLAMMLEHDMAFLI